MYVYPPIISQVRLQYWRGYRDRSVERNHVNNTPASSLDEGETVEDSYGPSHYAQRKDGKRDSDLLDSRIEQARLGAIPLGVN